MSRIPTEKNPFNPPQEVLDRQLLYRAIISPIRDFDQKEGNLFLERYLSRPEEWRIITLKTIAAIWDNQDPVTCPDDLLWYLKDIVGWDSVYDSITSRLDTQDLRKLISIGIPFWKERFSEIGIRNAIRLLTGRWIALYNWFDWRAIVGEELLTEEQVGYDFWIIGGIVSRFDEYYSQIRVMDDGSLDRRLILDVTELERVASERIEVAIVDFLDYFEGARDRWATLAGLPGRITLDQKFLLGNGTTEEPIINNGDILEDYVSISKFNLASGSIYYSYFYATWSTQDYYEVKVSKDTIVLTRYLGGTPSVLASLSYPTTLSFPIEEGLWYKLRISCVEEIITSNRRIKVYVDGNEVINLSDSAAQPVAGKVTLKATAGEVLVDNVEVYRVPLRFAEAGPSGITTSPNFYDP